MAKRIVYVRSLNLIPFLCAKLISNTSSFPRTFAPHYKSSKNFNANIRAHVMTILTFRPSLIRSLDGVIIVTH